MKNMRKLIGIISLALIIGLSFSCTIDPADSGAESPVAGDYSFSNMTQVAWSVTAVSILPKFGKSSGAISNIRYAGSTTIPQTEGTYAVTFDVAAQGAWKAAAGLSAGNLIVKPGIETKYRGTFDYYDMSPAKIGEITVGGDFIKTDLDGVIFDFVHTVGGNPDFIADSKQSSWAYLYNNSQKIGVVFIYGTQNYVFLGKDCFEVISTARYLNDNWEQGVDVDDMSAFASYYWGCK